MLEKKIDLVKIRVQDVGTACTMLASKFTRTLYAKKGIVIRLHHPNLLNTIAAYNNLINDDELNKTYRKIEAEVRRYVSTKLPPHYQNVPITFNKKIAMKSRKSNISAA